MAEQLPPVLLLDLDDTILADSSARAESWQVACEEVAPRAGVEAAILVREIDRTGAAFWSDRDRHRVWRQKVQDAYGTIAAQALTALGAAEAELHGAAIGERALAFREEARAPLPGALDALARFRPAGTRLGLITNGGGSAQRAKIERFALAGHFEYVGVEGEVGVGKPDPRAFERALAAFEVGPKDAWMVGDNLEWDVAGAQAVGIRGVWLDRHRAGLPDGTTFAPDRVVFALSELG